MRNYKDNIKNNLILNNRLDSKNNYIIFARDCYLNPNIISKNVKIMKTPVKINRKKQNFNNLNLSNEINVENKFNEINNSFQDIKGDRESLILQISEMKNINEIKSPQIKTQEISKMRYIKKPINRKINIITIKKHINYFNNINTPTFINEKKREKKYGQFTFHNKEEKYNNYCKRNCNFGKKKLLLGTDEKSLKIVNDNVINGKYKLLLKLGNKKNNLIANKSYDDIKTNNTKQSKLKLYSKKILNNKNNLNLINDTLNDSRNIKPLQREKYDYDFDNFTIKNKSFEFPFKYKKKIINNQKNKKFLKRNKTEDKTENISKGTILKHSKMIESRIKYSSLLNDSLISFDFNKEYTSKNRTLNISDIKENSFTLDNKTFIYEIDSTNNLGITINFEELMIIGERLYDIYKSLINNKKMANQSFEFLNYFFNSSLKNDIENIFLNSELKEAIYSINYILFFILVAYDYSFNIEIEENCFSLIQKIILITTRIYIVFCKFIAKKINFDFKRNKWASQLNNMINNIKNFINYIDNNIKSEVETIIYYTNDIIKNIDILLNKYKSNSNLLLLNFFQKISQKNNEEIKNFFDIYLAREQHLTSFQLKNKFDPIPNPYITKEEKINFNSKKYILVLGLEETLLNFQLDSSNRGILKFRPYLFDFLDNIEKYYELILFTSSDIKSAKSLIDTLEYSKKYFSYKFFLQHNSIINNNLVKDLSKIGIELDKIVIVDNNLNSYMLQKENGIYIKSFWGGENDIDDMKLFYLEEILVKIAKEGGDIRKGIEKYKEDIVEKISSNIYQYFNEC